RRRWRPVSRRSRWTRRRRNWLATSRITAASYAPRVSPSRCGCMTSRSRNSARSLHTASTPSLPITAGSVSASMPDTGAFAVESIRRWWDKLGQTRYANASRLVITADCGGSNGPRVKLWKRELQRFANETGLRIIVNHLPPGTSKWNKVEHRLFAFITQNWRGKPLVSYQVIVQ